MRNQGGLAARRAITRWAVRLFRREWRQQVLVIALLSLAVAVAAAGVCAAYNIAPRRDAEFGTADHRLVFDVSEAPPGAVDAYLAAATDWFGTIDPIGQGRIPVPGSTEPLEVRSQDPDGPLGRPMLRLREGRYPTAPGEVALTDSVAETMRVSVGGSFAVGREESTVVGLVENPHDLGDEFALVAPSSNGRLDALTVLVKANEERVQSFPHEHEPGPGRIETRGATENGTAAVGALAASAVLLLLVCLVAASGFAVVAQRRLRQLGMLAATGATQRHLRLVVVTNGAVVGATAAVTGAVLGLTGWIAVAPLIETAAGHRIDRFDVPWSLVGGSLLLAVGTACAAAWWPARTVARVPVTRALSGRPPEPRPARRSLTMAVALIAGGVASLMAGIDTTKDEATAALVIIGVLAIPLGIALISPLAIRALAPAAARLPIAARLALRDLARYHARAGAALAAISLGLGIAVATVQAAAAAEYRPDGGNLSDRQLMVRVDVPNEGGSLLSVPELTPTQLAGATSAVDQIATMLDDPDVVALDVPLAPAAAESRGGETVRPPVTLARPVGDVYRHAAALYVATPEALAHVGLDPASLDPDAEVLTSQRGPLYFVDASRGVVAVRDIAAIDVPSYSAAPRAFITPAAMDRHGWQAVPAAWLVETRSALTPDQIAHAQARAADAGLTVEVRRGQEGLSQLRSGATAAGVLLALGIVAMTVGLVRSEAAGEVRTLAAVGATGRTRRTVTGVTAGALALLGAVLGTAGAYTGLTAAYADDLQSMRAPPVVDLLVIAVGLPLAAATAAWLLAGRAPTTLARNPID